MGRASGRSKSAKTPRPLKALHFSVRKGHLEPFSDSEPLWAHLGSLRDHSGSPFEYDRIRQIHQKTLKHAGVGVGVGVGGVVASRDTLVKYDDL